MLHLVESNLLVMLTVQRIIMLFHKNRKMLTRDLCAQDNKRVLKIKHLHNCAIIVNLLRTIHVHFQLHKSVLRGNSYKIYLV